jgi:hypothetical protein
MFKVASAMLHAKSLPTLPATAKKLWLQQLHARSMLRLVYKIYIREAGMRLGASSSMLLLLLLLLLVCCCCSSPDLLVTYNIAAEAHMD